MRVISSEEVRKLRRSDVLSLGLAARLCRVSDNTVKRWCERGLIKHYRMPGTVKGDRRIFKDDLIRFMKENGMRLNELDARPHSLTVLTVRADLTAHLKHSLGPSWVVRSYSSVSHLILEASDHPCSVLLLDWAAGNTACLDLLAVVDRLPGRPTVVGVATDDHDERTLYTSGVKRTFYWPCDPTTAAKLVATVLE